MLFYLACNVLIFNAIRIFLNLLYLRKNKNTEVIFGI